MIIGYARTSTTDQIAGLEAQLRELQLAGCAKIFKEQASSVETRIQLESAIEFIREGDTLVVTKLDRLARSVSDLMKIIKELENKKVGLRILNLGMDTTTPTGKLMLTILGGVAQFEREIMLERQREGISKARAEGKYKGRKSIQPDIKQNVIKRVASGESKVEVARKLGIGEATVYRIIKSYSLDNRIIQEPENSALVVCSVGP
jgi:DNA invertase Pin-like site-specific DNA recombinase